MDFKYSVQCVHAISDALQVVLDKAILTDAFVFGHSELYLNFTIQGEAFCIQINCNYREAFFLFFEKETDRMPGIKPVFQELIGCQVETVQSVNSERIFVIKFKHENVLVFKCFGPLLNVLYFKNEHYVSMFRSQIKQDANLRFESFTTLNPIVSELNSVWYKVFELNNSYQIDTVQVPNSNIKLNSVDILEALTFYGINAIKQLKVDELKQQQLKSIKAKIEKCKRVVSNNQKKIKIIEGSVPYEEIGHLIMSNLHTIEKGTTNVKLFDFYRNQDIEIALNAKLNAVDNAAAFYRKSKNRRLEVQNAQELIHKNEKEIKLLEKALLETEQIQQLKQLKKTQLPESNSKPSLFKEFNFENYTILVGRNSKNNDVLTFQHAHKEDIWLHAKGVSGSHVIVKRKGSSGIPEPVINRAAELAAYFSKAKSSSMVLVMFTERKFVRKFKSALPGQVIVEKEQTILVEPKLN